MVSMENIIVEEPAEGRLVDPMTWFDSPGPFEIEIGCGKGRFLLSRARANPQLRMLGIEWAGKYYRYCTDRMARWGLRNVRVMRTDAKTFVMHHLPSCCVSVLHLYHPDPWPKKRHRKRRLVQPDFAEAVFRALTPGGRWLIQSDHEEYFQAIRETLDPIPRLTRIAWEEADAGPDVDWIGTNFEVKYVQQGRRIYRAGWLKAGGRVVTNRNDRRAE